MIVNFLLVIWVLESTPILSPLLYKRSFFLVSYLLGVYHCFSRLVASLLVARSLFS